MREKSAILCHISNSLLGNDSLTDMLLGNALRSYMLGDSYFLCCQFGGEKIIA